MAGRLDLLLCRRTATTTKVTKVMRAAISVNVSIVLVSGVREDWAEAGAKREKLRCPSYLLSRHKRHYRWRGGAVFPSRIKTIFEESGVRY